MKFKQFIVWSCMVILWSHQLATYIILLNKNLQRFDCSVFICSRFISTEANSYGSIFSQQQNIEFARVPKFGICVSVLCTTCALLGSELKFPKSCALLYTNSFPKNFTRGKTTLSFAVSTSSTVASAERGHSGRAPSTTLTFTVLPIPKWIAIKEGWTR